MAKAPKIDRTLVTYHCKFAGCPKTVEWPRVFFGPPDGWGWLEWDDDEYPSGMYCVEHCETLEMFYQLLDPDKPNG